jgi:hypothetical protein
VVWESAPKGIAHFTGVTMRISNSLIMAALVCATYPMLGQSNVSTAINSQGAGPSDPRAVAVIETAITALGGKATWLEVGGATAQAVIAPKDLPARKVNWSDDWSKGRVRFRRDSAASAPSQSSLIGSDASQVHMMPNGNAQPTQHDSGIVVLALGYPAPALILSSSTYACTFHLGQPINPRAVPVDPDPNEIPITETCPDQFYPGGAARLIWIFSKTTGMPNAVELPVWGQTHLLIRNETVKYVAFSNVQGRLVPSELKIIRVGGSIDQLALSNVTFVESIPDRTFQSGN